MATSKPAGCDDVPASDTTGMARMSDWFDGVPGIDTARVLDILARSIDCRVVNIEVRRRRDLEKHAGRSSTQFILEVVSPQHDDRRRLVFVKRSAASRSERQHYAALKGRCNIPDCLGAVNDSEGRELLFLEYVPRQVFLMNPAHLAGVLDAIAAINAADLSPTHDRARDAEALVAGSGGWTAALDLIGDHLMAAEVSREHVARIRRERRQLIDAANSMSAILHSATWRPDLNDPHQLNFGMREQSDEVVTYDLQGLGYFPGFFGVANLVLDLAGGFPSRAWLRGVSECYLERYNRRAGDHVTLGQFRQECTIGLRLGRLRKLAWRAAAASGSSAAARLDTREVRNHWNQLLRLAQAQ